MPNVREEESFGTSDPEWLAYIPGVGVFIQCEQVGDGTGNTNPVIWGHTSLQVDNEALWYALGYRRM